MKAFVLRHGGNIKNMRFEELEIPAVKPDELLIRVHAVSLNPSDYQTAEYLGELETPVVLGLDIAGEVMKAGENIKPPVIGKRVFYLREINNPYGGFAEYAVTPEKFVCEIPEELDYTQAAALPGAGMTAYHIMYDRFHLRTGGTILIQGGAGGVGSYLIQLAKLNGLQVITTCSKKNFDYVKKLGADFAIDYKTEDVYGRIKDITNQAGVDYAVNTVGSESAAKDMEILKFGGEIAAVSGLPDMSQWKFYSKGISVHEIAFGNYLTSSDVETQKVPAQTAKTVSSLVAAGKIGVPEICEIDFGDIPEYLQLMKEKKVHGKIVARL